jgi:hypothetical protein
MKARATTITVMVTILLILAVGTGVRLASSFRKPAPSPQATSPFGPLGPPGSALPDMSKIAGDHAAVFNLMNQHRFDPRLATFISQAKIELISQSNTSLHYVLTFPNGVTSDETITITPNQKYTPTTAELQRPKGTGIQIFNPKLSAKKTGPQETLFTLHYYALQSSLPADFQQLIEKTSSSSRSSGWDSFSLVPCVYAQEGGNNGSGIVTGEVAEFVKTEAVKGLEIAELERTAKFADNLLTIKDLVMGYQEMSGWLGEIAELQECAEHPTNPLTQKASETPEYQQQVASSLNDASWDVQMAAFPKVADIAAGTLTQFMKGAFGAGLLVAPITSANDEAIAEIVEGEIADARKGVTACHHEKMSAGQFRPMQANFKYTYNRNLPNECDQFANCSQGEEKRGLEGSAHMTPDSTGFLVGKGAAEITMQRSQHATNEYGCSSEWHETSNGAGEIELGAGGATPLNGVVKARFHTEALTTDGESKPCKLASVHSHNENGAFGVACDFYNVDFVHGGTYTAFDRGDSHGTCTLEIFP